MKRIQRRRAKGWRMPPGAVYVGRPSRWGNPCDTVEDFRYMLQVNQLERCSVEDVRSQLRGRDLACWCPLDRPCHADVLLEVANG